LCCRPVAFERDAPIAADPFGLDAFSATVNAGAKRGLDTSNRDDPAKKRARD